MGKHKYVSIFDKDQIVMVRQLDLSMSETAGLVECSHYKAVITFQKWSKEGPPVSQLQNHRCQRLTDEPK